MVDNFPGFPEGIMGPELMQNMRKQAERFGTEFRQKMVTSVDLSERPFTVTLNDGEEVFKTHTIVVANGASPRFLGLENEKRLMGMGVSTCATCDGFFFRDKEVAVIGGGDTAMEEAHHLAKGCKKVTIIHRREELRASKAMQNMVFDTPNIEFKWNSAIDDILGEQNVTGVRLKDTVTGELSEMTLDGVFIAIGHIPNTKMFQGQLEMDENGYLLPKTFTQASVPGVFVAGDITDSRYKQAISSAGIGCRAALDAEKFLMEMHQKHED